MIQRETLEQFLPDAKPIFETHHLELNVSPFKIPLDPDYEFYFELQRKNKLLLMTARREGELIGYYTGFITYLLHNKSIKANIEDIFWISPKNRDGKIAGRLFDEIEKFNKDNLITFWTVRAKIGTSACKFLERRGMKEIEKTYFWMGE